jgi:hypothetical protein
VKRLAARFLVSSIASTVAVVMLASPAPGVTGQITRADATPDWSRGSVAGSVAVLPPAVFGLYASAASAYVVPSAFVCHAEQLPGYFPVTPYPGAVRVVWFAYGDQDQSFDLPNVALDGGISPRVCLYATYKNLTLPGVWNATLLASRSFVVPSPSPTQGQSPVVTLSRATALAKAKSALAKRFGNAYKRGKRKRLACRKKSSTRYRCTFSFRYHGKRRKGNVTVAMEPGGAITTRINRR